MSFNDSIANMLTLVRNATRSKEEKVDIPHSKIIAAIADILKREGYIENYRIIKDNKQGILRIYLKYINKKSAIINLKRVSTSGRRVYSNVKKIPRVLRGKGIAILTTSKGVMTDREAKDSRVGGEILCYVW